MSDFKDGFNWAIFCTGIFDEDNGREYDNLNSLSAVIDLVNDNPDAPGMAAVRKALVGGWNLNADKDTLQPSCPWCKDSPNPDHYCGACGAQGREATL